MVTTGSGASNKYIVNNGKTILHRATDKRPYLAAPYIVHLFIYGHWFLRVYIAMMTTTCHGITLCCTPHLYQPNSFSRSICRHKDIILWDTTPIQTAHIKPVHRDVVVVVLLIRNFYLYSLVYQCVKWKVRIYLYNSIAHTQYHEDTGIEKWNGFPLGMILDSGSFSRFFLSNCEKGKYESLS